MLKTSVCSNHCVIVTLKLAYRVKSTHPGSVSKAEEEERRRSPGVCQQFTVMKEGEGKLFTQLKMWQTAQAIFSMVTPPHTTLGLSRSRKVSCVHRVRWLTAFFTLAACLGQCTLNPVNVYHLDSAPQKKKIDASRYFVENNSVTNNIAKDGDNNKGEKDHQFCFISPKITAYSVELSSSVVSQCLFVLLNC